MNPQTINAMEIVMLTIFVVLRIAGTCFIVWALARQAEASGGKYRCITVLENDLAEECADCLVMISQLRILIPGFSAKVDRVMHEKIERQINRISKEQQC